ncbi:toll/interleukin-1 receptor domain-containing protein [Algoriphagus aestuarii]|nr:toll/interleukin-1 receptor domain-containing protein [Algoriphagus aestuarii]
MKIFISHSSKNKDYGEALVNLLTAVGVKDDEIIFTSNDAYGIPIGQSIFNWLKSRISEKPHVLYLLSPEYYKSVACLNEMGAAWVVENKHTMIFTPEFNLSSPEFLNGAIDPREIGFYIDNHDKVIAFIESLRSDFAISSNQVLINQKIRFFLETIKSFSNTTTPLSEPVAKISHKALAKEQEPETKVQSPNSQVKPVVTSTKSTNSTSSRLITDLQNDKLKDEDVLLVHYIIDTGRFKLGTGWRTSLEIEKIKMWEEVNELNSKLSSNYEIVLQRLEMKNVTEVSDFTGGGNPREVAIKDNIKTELLEMSDELLGKINEVVLKNHNNSPSW